MVKISTKTQIAKYIYPELNSFWIEWLLEEKNKENSKRIIIDKIHEIVKNNAKQ